jgi:hypothetical protein
MGGGESAGRLSAASSAIGFADLGIGEREKMTSIVLDQGVGACAGSRNVAVDRWTRNVSPAGARAINYGSS